MKSAIMIAYAFPPEGNAGAYRPLRFVRNLPKFGWHSAVITAAGDSYERYDPELLTLVPPETRIIRVPNRDPWRTLQNWRAKRVRGMSTGARVETRGRINDMHQGSLRSFLRDTVQKAEGWFYHPDPDMGWIRPALKATLKICGEDRADVIWATAGPVSSFIVAQQASQRTRIPYVLDFRDAWTITYNDFEERRPTWAQRFAERSMYGLLEKAQSIVFRYEAEAECYWRAYKTAIDPAKIHIIPNGFEGAVEKFLPLQSDRCEILYTGTVADYRYNTLLRTLAFLQQSAPDTASRLHFHFVGEGTEAVANEAAALGLCGMVTTEGPMSNAELRKLMKQSHALLILGRHATMRGYELFAGAKLFGYLKTGMPILGVLPFDETRKILLRVGATTVADVDSQYQIAEVLRKLLMAWSQGRLLSLVPDRHACEHYSAERQTRDLIFALQGTIATNSFVPGSQEIPLSLRAEISEKVRRLSGKHLSARFTKW